MQAAIAEADEETLARLPDLRVRTDAESVAAFRRAAFLEKESEAGASGSEIPATYPFCWLTLPEVRPTLRRMIGCGGVLPVHEAQSFSYQRPLALDAEYRLDLIFKRSSAPDRLTVSGSITTLGDEPCAAFETVLRLVLTAGAAESAP
ncbi:conserved hypothetical protein [Methylocella silvestris BL2]|uniref:N-terminal of MaoC-like dehydratase domain-containing protein n=1 Tax=Methylocella silvestris (strain DSM 15510 / CIP 108128 / LMG 27833 / NCIMB 13906 / BL2) TaxID=395965 RepID=B8EPI6_METSB|nr:hypothetical protein [Methylocella silvestris]ACK50191.1 conserved hypothetical protein [Methylocella silvestris BL2]